MPEGLTFDLVVTTVNRVEELGRLLRSLAAQEYRGFRLIVVDQNDDGRLDDLLATPQGFPVLHLRSGRGSSRGRNVGLAEATADVVAFPDDDCAYPPDLLARVAGLLADEPALDGVTGRIVGFDGVPEPGSWRDGPGPITFATVWSSGVCATMFLRSRLVGDVGLFDTRLGLASDAGERRGEEIDYLVRSVASGGRLRYEPTLVVHHAPAPDAVRFSAERGRLDGLSHGIIMRKSPVPARIVARMLVRPLGGIAVRLAQRDLRGARFQAATLAGRVRGLLAAPSRSGGAPPA